MMDKQHFNTSLKCEGCVNSVRKGLNDLLGEDAWSVDLSGTIKTLEVDASVELNKLKPIFERVGHSVETQS